LDDKETSNHQENYDRDRLQMLASVNGAPLRAGIRLDGTGNAERNSSDQGESDEVSVLGDLREWRATNGSLDKLSAGQSVSWDEGHDEVTVPIEDHDVRRIKDTEKTNAINSLLSQYQVEVFASRFTLR
jgi:hypothetical protein